MKKIALILAPLALAAGFALAQTTKPATKPATTPVAAKAVDCVAALKAKVNINAAKLEEMKCLPGFSEKIAKDVMLNRPFTDGADFKKKIEDIGPILWKKIEPYAKFK